MQSAYGEVGHADRVGILAQFGQFHDIDSVGLTFSKPPQLGEASHQEPTIVDSRYRESANSGTKNPQVFRAPVNWKAGKVSQRKLYDDLVVAGKVVGDPQVARCLDAEPYVSESICSLGRTIAAS